ncbi:bifunctional phosphoribosyl-AMP cyclohydrolase /phosphoribosyl-ATP pyrophosphatase [Vibrio paracholerae]|nr:bifunctional phosphoribosyl-AMP cyclohydrolase /phosphoribosyl-ATP pyrophosphatase [Vibrio paracholerae]
MNPASPFATLTDRIDWQKVDGLVPAIVQDFQSSQVLMMGYMNPEALQKTLDTQQVTFFSRSKQRLWTKGETSGYVLQLKNIALDCDQDTLLPDWPNLPHRHRDLLGWRCTRRVTNGLASSA